MAVKSEFLLLRRCSGILNRVVLRMVNDCRETLLSLLACVCTVPSMIHVGVKAIVE